MKHRLRLVGRLVCWREGDGVATQRGSRPAETRGVIASSCVQSGGTAQPPLNPGAHPSPSRLLSGPLFTGCGQPRHPCPTGTVAGGGREGRLPFPSSLSAQHHRASVPSCLKANFGSQNLTSQQNLYVVHTCRQTPGAVGVLVLFLSVCFKTGSVW